MKAMKRVIVSLLVLTIFFSVIPVAQAAAQQGPFSGIQSYPPDHIWNVPIDTLPVHPMSATYIATSNTACSGGCELFVGRGTPLNVVDSTQRKQKLTSISSLWRSDDIFYPIPNSVDIMDTPTESSMFIIDRDAGKDYEMYNPVRAPDGTWSAQVAVMFDFSNYTLRPDNRPSVSASGLPGVPGMIRYEEVEAGSINHAMLVHMYTSGKAHVWPARANGVQNNAAYPPLGQRFRLKASFDTSGYSPHEKTILEAWKKYGFMLSDQNYDTQAWYVVAAADPRWDIDGSSFKNVHGYDFEAVDVSSLMIDENSGKARVSPGVSPTPTPTPTKTPTPEPSSQPDTGIQDIAIPLAYISIGIAAICCIVVFLKQ